MHPASLRIEDYTYDLPDNRIARYPLPERDASKLLVYDDGLISETVYRNIAANLPRGSLIVFNQTRVVNARLLFKKPSGGVIEVFCLAPHGYPDIQTAIVQKGKVLWECLVGGAGKWKQGMVLRMKNDHPEFTLSARIAARNPGSFVLCLEWDNEALSFAEVLQYAGKVPLPPYLHREAELTDESRYQTVYAREEGSVAAPTAGLHFTRQVMESLEAANIEKAFVTLHVGAGTFRPVKSETMEGHEMHDEWIEITIKTIRQLIAHHENKIIAVGTTSLRTIESLYWIGNKLYNKVLIDFSCIAVEQWEPYETQPECSAKEALNALMEYMATQNLDKLVGRTRILIAPGYTYRIADGLVTNFHQPKSTLLLLVAALAGDQWRKIYDYALKNDFRFLSYGDGSLLWMKPEGRKKV